MSKPIIVETGSFEYYEPLQLESMKKILKPFGLYVYEDPRIVGATFTNWIISNVKLTKKQLNEMFPDFE